MATTIWLEVSRSNCSSLAFSEAAACGLRILEGSSTYFAGFDGRGLA
jgi:hypothetical protein